MTCPCCGACHLDGPRACVREVRAELDRLRAELYRLRRLPVIATCGECGYESLTSDADGYEASVCTKSGPRQWLLVRADKEPPTWCPLRGAR